MSKSREEQRAELAWVLREMRPKLSIFVVQDEAPDLMVADVVQSLLDRFDVAIDTLVGDRDGDIDRAIEELDL